MKILITGCAGYIGSKLTTRLLGRGNDTILGIDSLIFGQNSLGHLAHHDNFKFHKLDVSSPEFANFLDNNKDIDVIILLAAYVGVAICKAHSVSAQAINYGHIVSIVDWIKNNHLSTVVIYPNTNSGYGIGGLGPCTEESKLSPISLYGVTKCAAESYIANNLPNTHAIFRLATVFGPSYRFRQDLLVNDFVARAFFDRFVVLFESGFRRNYIHVDDVVSVFEWAIDDKIRGIYNFGCPGANLTKKELCLNIKKYLQDFVIKEDEFATDPDKRDYLVSNDKILAAGFDSFTSLDVGIQQLIRFYGMLPKRDFTNA